MKKFKWGLIFASTLFVLIALPTPASAAEISSVSTSISAPVAGQTYKLDPASSNPALYKVTSGGYWVKCKAMNDCYNFTYMSPTDTFAAGWRYQVTFYVQATPGNTMRYPYLPSATVNGLSAGVGGIDTVSQSISVYQQFTVPYSFSLTPSSNFTFPAKTVGYSAPDGYEFTVKNTTGGSGATIYTNISGDGASAFSMKTALPGNPVTNIKLGTNGSVKFTITPKTGLSPGTYNASVTVETDYAAGKSFNINFTVNPVSTPAPTPATKYSITIQDDGNGIAWADQASAAAGTNITLFTNAKPGYMFKKWDVISGGVKMTGSEFTMPGNNVTIKALFEKKPDEVEQEEQDDTGVTSDEDDGDTATTDENDEEIINSIQSDDEVTADEGFNWLWVLFGVLTAVAATGGIWSFIVRKREKSQGKTDGNETDNDKANNNSKEEQI